MKKGDSEKVPADGERWDCPGCGEPMQRWKHADDWKPQPGKSWFTHWFECMNKHCRTKQVMPKGPALSRATTNRKVVPVAEALKMVAQTHSDTSSSYAPRTSSASRATSPLRAGNSGSPVGSKKEHAASS